MTRSIHTRALAVLLFIAVVLTLIPFMSNSAKAATAIDNPVAPESSWNKVDSDGWYVAPDGGFKFNVEDWYYYGMYGLTLIQPSIMTYSNAAKIAVYDSDADEYFETKTAEDFATVLGESVTSFEKTTVGNHGLTMYHATTTSYENYVFQANDNKYFINFIYGNIGTRATLAAFAQRVMETIVIANDELKYTVKSVSAVTDNGNVEFTVTTTPDINRVKVSYADDLANFIKYSNTYVENEKGERVFTVTVPAIVGETSYAFDGRKEDTNRYAKNYTYASVEVQEQLPNIIGVRTMEVDGKLVFWVTTKPDSFNRVKVAYADAPTGSIAVGSLLAKDENDNEVWVIKIPAPSEDTEYVFDVRTNDNKYLRDYYEFSYEAPVSTTPVKAVSHEIVRDKIIFTVVTEAGEYNRVKVALAENAASSLAVGTTYTVNDDGDYVWTVKTAAPTEATSYAFDLRTTDNKYLKDYFEYEANPAVAAAVKSVSAVIENGKIVFTVVTSPAEINRVKAALASEPSKSIGVADKYTVNTDGDYVWTVKATAPTESTSYAFDMRNTAGVYEKNYFTFDFVAEEILENAYIKSITHEIVEDSLIFTIVTNAGDVNRVKASLADYPAGNYAIVSKYTVNADGDYVWVMKTDAPVQDLSFVFDLRTTANKYQRNYVPYTVTLSVDHSDSSNWNTVKNNIFTSSNGGIQLDVYGWKYYGYYGVTLVPASYSYVGLTDGIAVNVYQKGTDSYDAPEVFENKTQADFESVLGTTLTSFEKTSLNYAGKSYTCYKAVADGEYYVWVFETAEAKYFINFMQLTGSMQDVGESIMTTIRIYEEPYSVEPADEPEFPNEADWNKVVNDVYTTSNGGVQFNASGWRYYGSYGITLVPTSYYGFGTTNAIAVNVYEPDGEEVFENKTQADFESVLNVTLNSFEKTEISSRGQTYTCYKAVANGQYYVWVFETAEAKYFINFMQASGNMQATAESIMETVVIYY